MRALSNAFAGMLACAAARRRQIAAPIPRALAVVLFAALAGAGGSGHAGAQSVGVDDGPVRDPFAPGDAAPQFFAGVGYANISVGDSDSPLDSEDALRFEFGADFAPFPDVPQLRLGAAIGTGIVFDSGRQTIVSDGGLLVVSSSDVPLLTFEPEARLSWRQTFGDSGQGGFFIEPGIAGGGFIAHLDFDVDDDDDVFDDDDDDFDEWDASFSARAFINVGVQHGMGAGGIQASYLRAGDLDLGGSAEGDVEEFYIGIFGSLRF